MYYFIQIILYWYPIYKGDSTKTCGIKWKLNNSDGFADLFTVYMYCDVNTAMHYHDFYHVLSTT